MIYGEKFLGYNVINESKEDKINKYKELIDKVEKIINVRYKYLQISCNAFEKTYSIYMKMNEKNMESSYKEIVRITEQFENQLNKVYDTDDLLNDGYDVYHKVYKMQTSLFSKSIMKDSEITKYVDSFKNKIKKTQNDTNIIYNKYKDYMENVDDSKVYQSINKKSQELYKLNSELSEEYENPDSNEVESWLDSIRYNINEINKWAKLC